ncbi:MAG: TdeIII family type II restriction endonuclease [Oscillospiraceae bacterium]|nr:TdeIII family type II restriction endonuclease [Oscillospiraceae bacterium]
MEKQYKEIIAKEFRDCVINTIKRLDNTETNRPFHTALLSDEALFWSRFERSFSTSFGQRVIEEISKVVAIAGGATDAIRQKETIVVLDKAVDEAITNHIQTLRASYRLKWRDTVSEMSRVYLLNEFVEHRIISDLWWYKNDVNHYMSIKTVKPNIDQTSIAKQDLLRLTMSDSSCKAYFGLYYNPYGEERSSYAHNPPMSIFDFHSDSSVLIGRDYWDTLGGVGCYDIVLDIAREVGAETREIVKKLR